ncbi:aminoacetone oxidase family FAD-binding enzyme [Candidatus Gracilibacteria bacterium]|nr:aminoacetone oxidase family FAD-binding enzyme [Candidatus Gracilibacteria bacterium]
MSKLYDVVIIGGGAAGLFAGICLDKKLSKIVLEKNEKPGIKVLLSGGERANVSNMDIEPERDYFTQNKKFLLSVFAKYNNWDIMSFFAEAGVNIVEEDRSRLILESGDSKELLACLLKKLKENNCDLKNNHDIVDITPDGDGFIVSCIEGRKYKAKKVILSSGGKSFGQVGTTGEGYNMSEKLGLSLVTPYRTLCGMATKRDLSEISGVSSVVDMKLVDNSPNPFAKGEQDQVKSKIIYQEKGPILFTHFGVSGPIIHNCSNAVGEYLNKIGLQEEEFEKYMIENLSLDLRFDLENSAKRLVKFYELTEESLDVNLGLQNWRSWKEAKATGGGVDTAELDNYMQAKKQPGLYIIGEVVDVTGKTGGFNLQWAWSSGFVAAQGINKKLSS